MIQQPTGTKQMTLKIDCYVKMKVYSNDFSRWTLTMRVIGKKKEKKRNEGGRRKKVIRKKTSHLVTKLQITHPPPVLSFFLSFFLSLASVWLSLSLSHTNDHTHIQTHSPVQCCQQSPLTVYHGCGNSSSVMYERNASENKHETLDAAHTERHQHAAPSKISSWSRCRAHAAAKAMHKIPLLHHWICEEEQLNQWIFLFFCFFFTETGSRNSLCLIFRICVTTHEAAALNVLMEKLKGGGG